MADTPEKRETLSNNPVTEETEYSSRSPSKLENGVDPLVVEVDPETEKRVLRKLDYRIIPTVMWIYLMNMMDRGV